MRHQGAVLAGFLLFAGPASHADQLAGNDRFLCSAVQATICTSDGVCESGLPWNWQVPQFLIIDLDRKELATTEASGENRTTPILSLNREQGEITVQGVQKGRAFSMVLREDSGLASIAIAADGLTIGVFGACTPAPAR
jgi:hypothetical protein